MTRAPALLIVLFAGALVGGLGAWVFAAGVRASILGWLSRGWPAVRGRIEESRVVETSRGARVAIRYVYEVDGVARTGDTLGFATSGSRWISTSRRDEIRALAERYATGSEVAVFYWPARASVSVLQPGFHRASVALMAMGAAWLGVGVAVGALAFLRHA